MPVGAVGVSMASGAVVVVMGPLFTSALIYVVLSAVAAARVVVDGGSTSGTIAKVLSIYARGSGASWRTIRLSSAFVRLASRIC